MSTQLILYPQNYQGQHNVISTSPTEMLVDGIYFTGVANSSSYDSPSNNVSLDVITNAFPSIPNTWYRFRSTVTGTPSLPTVTSGDLVLNATTVATVSGIYQRLTNLTIGQQYTVTVAISTGAAGSILITTFNGAVQNSTFIGAASAVQLSTSFLANAIDNVVMITYYGTVSDDVTISGISVQPQGVAPNFNNFELTDGQVILDLYEDESIPLTLSVDDFKNTAEKVQSYSKAFNLPGTKRNNLIFDNIFDVTRSDTGLNFNPYIKTKSILKQDGFTLFEGYLRLIDIQDKEGEVSYNVNLYSEVIALADVLGEKTFNDMDFLELEHDYNKTEIKNSWNESGVGIYYPQSETSGFRSDYDTVKYPFVDWNHQMVVSDGSLGISGNPQLTKLEQAFRPFIQIRYLIQRIFAETNQFSYTSNFFDSDEFKRLYMDFNWGSEEDGSQPIASNYLKQADNHVSDYFINETTYNAASKLRFNDTVAGDNSYWDNTNYKYTSIVNNWEVNCDYYIHLESDATVSTYSNNVRIAKFNAANQWLETFAEDNSSIPANDDKYLQGTFSTLLNTGEYIQAQSTTLTPNKIRMGNDTPYSYLEFISNNNSGLVYTLLTQLRGELGQWDVLKGIMTMFNLISIPDTSNPNNILIEPYADVFITNPSGISLVDRGIAHDWTDKIDVSDMKLKPLIDLNKKTIFKFVEDEDDYVFNFYKFSVNGGTPADPGHLYGSLIFDASAFTVLDGEEEIVAEPFAATVPKPLMSNYTDLIVPSLYAMDDAGTTEGFDNSPRIMYNNGVKNTVSAYYIPAQNGQAAIPNETEYLQFSHLTDIPTNITVPPAITDTNDFHFGACQLIQPIGNPATNNLFNLYWLPYFNELYNADTRTMTLKVNLTPGDLSKFEMYDTVFIKNRQFRVNKIDYKPGDLATVEFILII